MDAEEQASAANGTQHPESRLQASGQEDGANVSDGNLKTPPLDTTLAEQHPLTNRTLSTEDTNNNELSNSSSHPKDTVEPITECTKDSQSPICHANSPKSPKEVKFSQTDTQSPRSPGSDSHHTDTASRPPSYEDAVSSTSSSQADGSKTSRSSSRMSSTNSGRPFPELRRKTPGRKTPHMSSPNRFKVSRTSNDPLKRVSDLTGRSALSTASDSTRAASIASSMKEDDCASLLDDVFWVHFPSRTLEGAACMSLIEQRRDDAKEKKQGRAERPRPSVTILLGEDDRSGQERVQDVSELKRRLSITPRPVPTPKPDDYILLSCIVTCCCNPILGLIALGFAFVSNDSYQKGDVVKATSYSRRALLVSVVGIFITTAIALALLIIYWPSNKPDPTPLQD